MSLDSVVIKIEGNVPQSMSSGASGFDLSAHLQQALYLLPRVRYAIPTGLYVQLAPGYEAQVRPRSSMSIYTTTIIPNSPGTIDADYRGQILVPMRNIGNSIVIIYPGDRIAQLIFARIEKPHLEIRDALSPTIRDSGGFGSTGLRA